MLANRLRKLPGHAVAGATTRQLTQPVRQPLHNPEVPLAPASMLDPTGTLSDDKDILAIPRRTAPLRRQPHDAAQAIGLGQTAC